MYIVSRISIYSKSVVVCLLQFCCCCCKTGKFFTRSDENSWDIFIFLTSKFLKMNSQDRQEGLFPVFSGNKFGAKWEYELCSLWSRLIDQ